MTFKHSNLAIVPIGSHTRSTTNGAATLSIPSGATGIYMQNTVVAGTASATINFTLDGTAASSTVGFLLEAGDSVIRLDTVADVKVWLDTAAVLEYQWFKAL